MHIIHVIPGIWQHTGGPAEVVPKLCQNLVRLGCKVTLLTLDGPHSDAALECARKGVDFRSYRVLGRFGNWYSPKLAKDLGKLARECDVIHNHGFWNHCNWSARKWAETHRKPLLITPQGILSRDIFAGSFLRSFMKKVAWGLLDRRSVEYAFAIQAYSEAEQECMQHISGKNVVIIPNGVDLWTLPDKDAFKNRFPQTKSKHILLFLSRIHPIKGVSDLIYAWRTLAKEYQNWHLVLAGEGEKEYVHSIYEKIKSADLDSCVTMIGPQYGSEKLEVFAAADAFILPSYGEGMSVAILEALMCRLPLIYTIHCRFPEVAERGAGLLGATGVESLKQNVRLLMQMSEENRTRMGEAGRKLIQEKFTWPRIAAQMIDVYKWCLGQADRPDCVRLG